MKFWPLFLCAPLVCHAQFSNLATTATGDRVFFSTPLRQPGMNQFPHAKLFRLDTSPETQLALLYQAPWTSYQFYPGFAPAGVQASADGAYVAFTTINGCTGGSSCFFLERANGRVLDVAAGQTVFTGNRVFISRNGRFAASEPTSSSPAVTAPVTVVDRSNNDTHTFDRYPLISLTSQGSALFARYAQGMQLVAWSGVRRTFPPSSGIAMDDAATTILLTSGDADQARLAVHDIASGSQWQLGPDDRAAYCATISDDGRWVLYVTMLGAAPQLMLSHPDGSAWKQITADLSGIREGVLSGDGRVAWASTLDGRLLRIDTATLATREILRPPVITGSPFYLVPGSLVRLTGSRLGARVQIDGVDAPVLAASESEVVAQVPWDLPAPAPHDSTLYMSISSSRTDSPLESATPEYNNYYATYSPAAWIAAIHEDWRTLVDASNPAHPGETLHIYATGLGPTACAVATGAPAPVDRLCPVTRTIDWSWWWTDADSIAADVRFAGFAPGQIGLYQIDVTVPGNPPAARLKLIADRNGNFVAADIAVQQ